MFYSYPKQLDAMIGYIYTTSQEFLNSSLVFWMFFLNNYLLLTKPAFI